MVFEDWIKKIIDSGNLCEGYTEKVSEAESNRKLMDIVLDANGISYLCEMQKKGIPLPYEIINTRFGAYINGRYKAQFANDKGNGYTSSLYCATTEDVVIDTTIACLLGCTCKVSIPPNAFVRLYCDKNCDLIIDCPASSKLIVDYWQGFTFDYADRDSFNNITFNKH